MGPSPVFFNTIYAGSSLLVGASNKDPKQPGSGQLNTTLLLSPSLIVDKER